MTLKKAAGSRLPPSSIHAVYEPTSRSRRRAHSIGASLVLAASVALVAALAVVEPTLAGHEPSRLGLTPIGETGQFFNLTLAPGESRQLKVEVANFGQDGLMTRTYAADGYTIINGGFGAELFGDRESGTTLWLEYPDEEFLLEAGASRTIEFNVSVPAGTSPGDYITSLVVENVEPFREADPSAVTVEQVNRTAVAVAIDVPGPRQPALEIGAVGHKAMGRVSYVTFDVSNPGNVHLKPAGSFILRNAQGQPVATYEPVMDSVYAGTDTLLEAPLGDLLAPGEYCAELTLTDDTTGVSDSTTCLAFTVTVASNNDATGEGSQTVPVIQTTVDAADDVPLLAALILVVGGIALLVALYALVRRRRSKRLGGDTRSGNSTVREPGASG